MSDNIIGLDTTLTVPTSTPQFKLGLVAGDSAGNSYLYGRVDTTGCSAGDVVIFTGGFSGDQADTTSSAPGTGQGKIVGVALVTMTSQQYGWFQTYGLCAAVNGVSDVAAYTQVNTTATAGRLNDDGTTGSEVISGLVFTEVPGTDNLGAALLSFPVVGRTL